MTLDEQLESLCEVLDQELARQERLAAVCESMRDAARAHDMEAVEAQTASMVRFLEEVRLAEEERMNLLREIVAALVLPPERQTMSDLIAAAPKPWNMRLRMYQERLRMAMAESRASVREIAPVLRRGIRVVSNALGALHDATYTSPRGYTAAGMDSRMLGNKAALMDFRG